MAKPGTDGINRYATGRVVPAGAIVTAMLGVGVALDATDRFGVGVGAGAATQAEAQRDSATATT